MTSKGHFQPKAFFHSMGMLEDETSVSGQLETYILGFFFL